MKSRGQNAIEYMMTYGWAILIILIVGVVVWQTGFLELSRNVSPGKRGFSQLTPLDWSYLSDGTFTLVLQNNAGTLVDITSASANVVVGGGSCTVDPGITFPVEDFRPASTERLDFQCATSAQPGEYYRVNVTVVYVNPSSGLSHASNGVVWGGLG